MPFRFRRSIRIAPGIRLNASKSGLSTSVGKRGAHVTLGHGRTRTTVGIPDSSLSYTTSSSRKRRHMGILLRLAYAIPVLVLLWLLGWI